MYYNIRHTYVNVFGHLDKYVCEYIYICVCVCKMIMSLSLSGSPKSAFQSKWVFQAFFVNPLFFKHVESWSIHCDDVFWNPHSMEPFSFAHIYKYVYIYTWKYIYIYAHTDLSIPLGFAGCSVTSTTKTNNSHFQFWRVTYIQVLRVRSPIFAGLWVWWMTGLNLRPLRMVDPQHIGGTGSFSKFVLQP